MTEIGTFYLEQIRSKPNEICHFSGVLYDKNKIIVICAKSTLKIAYRSNFIIEVNFDHYGKPTMNLEEFPPCIETNRSEHSSFIVDNFLIVGFGDKGTFEFIDMNDEEGEFLKLSTNNLDKTF